jgi:hypothetical protein
MDSGSIFPPHLYCVMNLKGTQQGKRIAWLVCASLAVVAPGFLGVNESRGNCDLGRGTPLTLFCQEKLFKSVLQMPVPQTATGGQG